MHATGGDTADHDHEVSEARWMGLREALRLMTYPNEREIVRHAAALPVRPGALRLRGRERRRDARGARPQHAPGARGARAPHLVLRAQASSASPSASATCRTISRSLG